MDGLNYHHLLYFWTVARTGSIAKASVELGLTQPTISEQLRLLEKSLGHGLFERAGRSLVLTEKGSKVLAYAEKIFALGKELTAAVSETHASTPQTLRIAVSPKISVTLAAQTLRSIAKLDFATEASVISESGERALNMLRDGKLDLVLSGNAELLRNSPGAHRHLVLESGTCFFGTRSAAARFPKSLHDQRILFPAEPIRSQLSRWLKANHIATQSAGEIESPDLALAEAENGLGVAVLPALTSIRTPKLKLLGTTNAVRWRLYAFTTEKRPRHPVLAAIVGSQPRRVK